MLMKINLASISVIDELSSLTHTSKELLASVQLLFQLKAHYFHQRLRRRNSLC